MRRHIIIEVRLIKGKCFFFVSVSNPPPINNDLFIFELENMSDMLFQESDNIILMCDMINNMKHEGRLLHNLCDIYI